MNINKEKMTEYLERRINNINIALDRYPENNGSNYLAAKADAFKEILQIMDLMEESEE